MGSIGREFMAEASTRGELEVILSNSNLLVIYGDYTHFIFDFFKPFHASENR